MNDVQQPGTGDFAPVGQHSMVLNAPEMESSKTK